MSASATTLKVDSSWMLAVTAVPGSYLARGAGFVHAHRGGIHALVCHPSLCDRLYLSDSGGLVAQLWFRDNRTPRTRQSGCVCFPKTPDCGCMQSVACPWRIPTEAVTSPKVAQSVHASLACQRTARRCPRCTEYGLSGFAIGVQMLRIRLGAERPHALQLERIGFEPARHRECVTC